MAADAAQEGGRVSRLQEEEDAEELEIVRTGGEIVAVETSNNNNVTWRAAARENQVLRLDMDSMRTRVHQLEKECSSMKKVIEKIDKRRDPPTGWRDSLNRKFGCKFKTQVCDSHEQTVVDRRKGRQHHHHQQ